MTLHIHIYIYRYSIYIYIYFFFFFLKVYSLIKQSWTLLGQVEMLGWMQGGYNVAPLVEALDLDQETVSVSRAPKGHDIKPSLV